MLNTPTLEPIRKRVRETVEQSLPYFQLMKRRHYQQCRVTPSLCDHPGLLESLQRDGVVVVPDFMDEEFVEAVRGETGEALRDLESADQPERGKAWIRSEEEGVYRIRQVTKVSPTSARFFDHPTITGLARAYVAPEARAYIKQVELRTGPGCFAGEALPHFDDWKHRFKAILFLTEVGPKNAPFVYYTGSHRPAPWRIRKEHEYHIQASRGSWGHFYPHQMDHLCEEYGYRRKVVTGGPGTLILFDARGLHNATIVQAGYRESLSVYFAVFFDRYWKEKIFG